MQFELTEEQSLLCSALEQLLKKYRTPPLDEPAYAVYSPALQQELNESGFLDVATTEGYGPLEAALLVEAIAKSPWAVEAAASALVAPALGLKREGPVALCEGVERPTRYLVEARHAVLREGDALLVADLEPGEVKPVESVLAYPIGVLEQRPRNCTPLSAETAAIAYRQWRIALAAEAAGLMRAAIDLTVGHVKERRQFNQPLGDFQAIQHRLAADEQIVSASFVLTLRAAQSQRPEDAATAALYVQEHMRKIIYDCHQFSGAMGVTLEYPLHLWTYRLKFIQGELGGRAAQAAAVAEHVF